MYLPGKSSRVYVEHACLLTSTCGKEKEKEIEKRNICTYLENHRVCMWTTPVCLRPHARIRRENTTRESSDERSRPKVRTGRIPGDL
jgi:hypothetical protein